MLKKLNNFLQNTSGSILPTMGLLIIPLTIVAGATLDYTRYVNMKNEIQSGVDAAGIATVTELPKILQEVGTRNLSGAAYTQAVEDGLRDYAQSFLDANITSPLSRDSYIFNVNYIPPTLNDNGGMSISAEIEYDTIFGGKKGEDGGILLFKDVITDNITSIINTGNRTVEIALVIDNSGSMAFKSGNLATYQNPASVSQRRITLLKEAANDLIDDLEGAVENAVLEKPLQFSVVPFSSSVNVGNLNHENHEDGNNFMDINGFSATHNENLDWVNTYRRKNGESVVLSNNNRTARLRKVDNSTEPLTRFNIFGMMNTEWEGCVEMRPWPHNITDTYRNNTSGYNANASNALFVPYMVPDEPDSRYFNFYSNSNKRIEYTNDRPSTGRNDAYQSYIEDFFDYDPETQLAFPRFAGDDLFPRTTSNQGVTNADVNSNQITRTNWISKYQAFQGLDPDRINNIDTGPTRSRDIRRLTQAQRNFYLRNQQLKDMLNDIDIPTFEKNLNANNSSYYGDSGPNAFCPDSTVLQLTDDFQEVRDSIDSMEAHGGTNLQVGLTWGWRTLSQAMPFDGGRPLTELENRKILILLTDGNNQMITQDTPNETRYTAWGYQRNNNVLRHATSDENTHRRARVGINRNLRKDTIFESQFNLNIDPQTGDDYADLMNLHTNQACNNIKNDGITIYTIAFDVAPGGKVRELLENCAGSGKITIQNEQVSVINGVQFYHDVQGEGLKKTFAEISSSITAIRIAQ